MALPQFFSRVADSLRPVANIDPDTLASKLNGVAVHIELHSAEAPAQEAFRLACNLAARLYPRISVSAHTATGDERNERTVPDGFDLVVHAKDLILGINPAANVIPVNTDHSPTQPVTDHDMPTDYTRDARAPSASSRNVRLCIGPAASVDEGQVDTVADGSVVTVDATGWSVLVDPEHTPTARLAAPSGGGPAGHPLAWLAAGALGMAEIFRVVFAAELGPRGRTSLQPGGLDLLTSRQMDPASTRSGAPDPMNAHPTNPAPTPGQVDLGEVHLIGAGAIGQAAVYALRCLDVTGVVHVVDPETVTLSNLQRYVLTDAGSVGNSKVDLVRNALTQPGAPAPSQAGSQDETLPQETAERSNVTLEVRPFTGRWGDLPDHLQVPQALVALDSAKDRITVAATMPTHAYNAWTQTADLGWSRHEEFGTRPCLACLYYPSQPRLSEHELIAEALHQHPLRVLAYLIYNVPIGFPLPGLPALAELQPPPGAEVWGERSLVDDLVSADVIDEVVRSSWSTSTIGALYRDGICAGGLLPVGDLPGEVLVPLAHQSALAGILLVAELLWSRDPHLRSHRDAATEHRYDVLRGFPQVVTRPRERTAHCLCGDAAYVSLPLGAAGLDVASSLTGFSPVADDEGIS